MVAPFTGEKIMGWTCTKRKPAGMSVAYFLIHESGSYSWDGNNADPARKATYTVLDWEMAGRALYVAVERLERISGARKVFACVTIHESQNGEFCWKDMDESMGPNESRCPMHILRLLTPLDGDESAYAGQWRERCYAFHGKTYPAAQPSIELFSACGSAPGAFSKVQA
jgi:hypothetical protein